MSFPVTNPRPPPASCQAGCKGCEELGLAGGSGSPREAEMQWPLLGRRTQISEAAGGCRWAGSRCKHDTRPCLSTCSLVWRKPLGLSCPPMARRKYGQDIFLGTGTSSITGLHMLPDPSELLPPGTANRFLLLQRGGPAVTACQCCHWDHLGLFQLNNGIIFPKPHWSCPCRSHRVLTASHIFSYWCK